VSLLGILDAIERYRVVIGTVLFMLILGVGGLLVWHDFHQVQPSSVTVTSAVKSAQPTAETTQLVSASSTLININTATVSELDNLPGIGPVYAQRIVDYRSSNGEFTSTSQLKSVKGIGTKTFDKLKSLITVGGS